jgi:esterase/lipase superfamily enzyme
MLLSRILSSVPNSTQLPAKTSRVTAVRVILVWLIIAITSLFQGCVRDGARIEDEEVAPGLARDGGKGLVLDYVMRMESEDEDGVGGTADDGASNGGGAGILYKPAHVVVSIFYATDRNQNKSTKPAEFFGAERSELSYGICQVSIPRDHRMGVLESPSIWKLEFREDPAKHVVLWSIIPIEKNQYFVELGNHIRASSGKNAFVFVHGYNVTFEDAARRTAQIAYDLGFDGAPILYSWPSQGTFVGYPIDETNIEWTQANLRRFLDDVVLHTTIDNIYLIAHSMGNRALTRAFNTLVYDNPTLRQRFRAVILTAPDIDTNIFKRDIVPQLVGGESSVTLYASAEDKALLASKKFHGYPRAGDTGPGLILVPGIDTIDATGVDTSFLGHSYFADARSVLADIFYLIRDGKRPDHRFALEPVDMAGRRYWRFKR